MEFNRRNFLGVSAGGFASMLMHHRWNFLDAQDEAKDAKSCIVLWMDGGPSHLDTWDPKEGHKNGGPVKAIGTSAKDIKISGYLPQTAKWMHKGAIVRSVTSNEQDHARAAYMMHTGYKPTAMLTHPTLGSIAAYESKRVEGMPAYVSIRSAAAFAFNQDPGPGFLGPDVSPFIIDKPEKPYETIKALGDGIKERVELLEDLNKEFRAERPGENSKKRESMVETMKSIKDSVFAKALDLRDVTPETLARYCGDNKPGAPAGPYQASPTQFGHGCLLARRLVGAGCRFVEVNLGGWDTHGDNFNAVGNLCKILDPGLSSMMEDLEKAGQLDKTLIVWMGEFGRTPVINGGNGRDHWPNGYSVAMWGGGIGGGRVYGDTGPDGQTLKDACQIPDLFATMVHVLGIDPNKRYAAHDVGAVRITDNGKAIKALCE